jgi:hypothetical protein
VKTPWLPHLPVPVLVPEPLPPRQYEPHQEHVIRLPVMEPEPELAL